MAVVYVSASDKLFSFYSREEKKGTAKRYNLLIDWHNKDLETVCERFLAASSKCHA